MRQSSVLFTLLGTVGFCGLLSGCSGGGGDSAGTGATSNAAPVINSTPVGAGVQGEAYSYPVKATDVNGDPLTYSLVEPIPFGMSIAPTSGLITWTPAAQAGPNQVIVKVSDGSLADIQAFTVTVDVATTPAAPVFITPRTLPPAFVGIPYTATVIATDANNDAITYSITASPSGVVLNSTSGAITWTPDLSQVGDQAVTIGVEDAGGLLTSHTFTINVNTATAATGVTFGFDSLSRGGYNVLQPGIWTNRGVDTFSTESGSAIIVRADAIVTIGNNGRPRLDQPEFTFWGVDLISRGTAPTTFIVAGYNGSHADATFSYTKTVAVGSSFRVRNNVLDDLGRPMNVSIDRLEVTGVNLTGQEFGVSCLGVGTASGVPTCP
jgi:Putative Ig domain